MPPLTTYTVSLTPEQVALLRQVLADEHWEFEEKQYTLFAAKKGKLNLAVYQKGPKVLVQGKGLEDFITFVLEPRVLMEAKLGYEEELQPELYAPHFGIDESGKGDFFGPLVIAGVFVDREIARRLRDAGIRDSKSIGSDKVVRDLAKKIRGERSAAQTVIAIGPERYNQLHKKFGNLNKLLAWGHARAIENLLEQRPDCPRALSDQFANPRVLMNSLLEKGRAIELVQRTKAESDYAVAAASILAREKFIDWLDSTGEKLGVKLARGVSEQTKSSARSLIAVHGPGILPTVAKTHFKTASEVLAPEGTRPQSLL